MDSMHGPALTHLGLIGMEISEAQPRVAHWSGIRVTQFSSCLSIFTVTGLPFNADLFGDGGFLETKQVTMGTAESKFPLYGHSSTTLGIFAAIARDPAAEGPGEEMRLPANGSEEKG